MRFGDLFETPSLFCTLTPPKTLDPIGTQHQPINYQNYLPLLLPLPKKIKMKRGSEFNKDVELRIAVAIPPKGSAPHAGMAGGRGGRVIRREDSLHGLELNGDNNNINDEDNSSLPLGDTANADSSSTPTSTTTTTTTTITNTNTNTATTPPTKTKSGPT